MNNKLLSVAKRIQAIAQAGLTYSEGEYDIERYKELRKISIDIMSLISNTKIEKIEELFANETGYQTPKVDIRAVIFTDNNILLVREKIDGLWSLPGGWAEIGLTPGENAKKEVKEEAGLEVIPKRILAILDKKCHDHPPSPYHTYKIFILCEIKSGQLSPGLETDAVKFFTEKNLPRLSIDRNTKTQLKILFDLNKNSPTETVFD